MAEEPAGRDCLTQAHCVDVVNYYPENPHGLRPDDGRPHPDRRTTFTAGEASNRPPRLPTP